MREILFNIQIGIMCSIVFIYIVIIVPKLRQNKKIASGDWFLSGLHNLKHIYDYYHICIKNREPLTWFYIFIGLFILFFINTFAN